MQKYPELVAIQQFEESPSVSGDLPSSYMKGVGFAEYVTMESEESHENFWPNLNDPKLRQAREQLKNALNEAVAANGKLKVLENSIKNMDDSKLQPGTETIEHVTNYMDHVASLWDNVEEIEATISHLKTKVPKQV